MTRDFESELDLSGLKIGTLSGGITRVTVMEKDAVGTYQDTHIIRSDRDWQITVKWELRGTMLDSQFFTIPGKWVVKAYLEGWGGGAEMECKGDTGAISVVPAPTVVIHDSNGVGNPLETEWRYVETFTFLAGVTQPGPYRLAVTITYLDKNGNPGPMAGFVEIRDMVQVYEPGP